MMGIFENIFSYSNGISDTLLETLLKNRKKWICNSVLPQMVWEFVNKCLYVLKGQSTPEYNFKAAAWKLEQKNTKIFGQVFHFQAC